MITDYLREIRDKAWQMNRHERVFSDIEELAEKALLELGIDDRPYPNPRPNGWWRERKGDQ
jgi:hypothetical protein